MEEILNKTVANLIILRYQAKNAHWNTKGMLFYEFHLLFDRIYDAYDDLVDRIAERFAGKGGRVSGTLPQIIALTDLPDQPVEVLSSLEFAKDLLDKIKLAKEVNLRDIDELLSKNEQTSANILMDVDEVHDTHIYLLESSLR